MKLKRLASLCLAVLILFTLNIGTATVMAEETDIIRNDETGIPDAELYAAALELGDANKDGILTVEEANNLSWVRQLSLGDCKNLKGIELLTLTGVEEVFLDITKGLDISPLLSLPQLTGLFLSDRSGSGAGLSVGDFDFSQVEKFTNLKSLSIGSDAFVDLTPLASLTNLEELSLTSSEISNISPLASLTKLKELYLNNNDFFYKDDNTFYPLDKSKLVDISALSSLTDLNKLTISSASLKDISPLSSLKQLTELYIDASNIIDLSPLQGLTELQSLNLSVSMNLEDISALSSLKKLNRLHIRPASFNFYLFDQDGEVYHDSKMYNNVTDISPLLSLTELKDLTITCSPKVTDISLLSALTKLESLLVYNYTEHYGELGDFTVVTRGSITDISFILSLENLHSIHIRSNSISTLPDLTESTKLNDPEYISLAGNFLTEEELKAKLPSIITSDQNWLEYTKYTEQPTIPEQPVVPEYIVTTPENEIPSNIAERLEDESVSGITVTLTQSDVVAKEIFQAAQKNKKDVSFNVLDKQGNTSYQWTFQANEIDDNIDIDDLDLNIQFATEKQDEIQAITGQQDLLYLSFAHHGSLPGIAQIKVYVGDKYQDGEVLYLYYYNEAENTVELKGKQLAVNGGYVEFSLSHCSDYFFADKEITSLTNNSSSLPSSNTSENENVLDGTGEIPQTGGHSITIYFALLLVLSGVAVFLLLKMRRKTVS